MSGRLLGALRLPVPPHLAKPGAAPPKATATGAPPTKPAHPPAAKPPGKVTGAPSAGSAVAPAPASPPALTFNLVVGTLTLKGVSQLEAMRALADAYRKILIDAAGAREGHADKIRIVKEMPVTGWISEKMGRAKLPPLTIWDEVDARLAAVLAALKAVSVGDAAAALDRASETYVKAYQAFKAYEHATEAGAERAVTTLKVTATVGAVAAGVATGGAASAAGLGVLGTAGVGGLSAGAYGMVQEGAGQASSVYIANIKKKIDWDGILRRGANDAINGFVGGLLGGALTKQFSKLFGSYIKLSPAELEEFGKALGMKGPLPADYFMTAGQKFVAEFLSGAALAPVTAAITIAVNKVSGGEKGPENMSEFMKGVAGDIAQGGLIQLFIAFLTHKMPATRGSSGDGHGEASGKPSAPTKPLTLEPPTAPRVAIAVEPPVAPKAPRKTTATVAPELPVAGPKPAAPHPAEPPAGGASAPSAKKTAAKDARPSTGAAVELAPAKPAKPAPAEPVAATVAEPAPVVTGEPVPAKPAKAGKGKRQSKGQRDEAIREQRRIDVEHGEQVAGADQHASKKKSRKLQREEARQGARHDPQAAAVQAGEQATAMINDAKSGKFTSLKDGNKRAMVVKLEQLMEQAGWSSNKRNPLKGAFDEALRTPKGAKGQPEYLAGGSRLPDQGRRGTARPDYSRKTRGKEGGATAPMNEHVNLKADNLQMKTEGEALSSARKYVQQAQRNAKALPIDAGVVLRYGARPVDALGASASVEAAMNLIHFAADSPIVEVHYGTVAYRRPGS